jgi:hypothetical protein
MAQALKYPTSINFLQKTLGSGLSAGVTASATLSNTTSIQNKPGVMIVDRINSQGTETPTKREVIAFTATSGSTVTTLTRNADGSGSDQDHAVGAIVEFGPDVLWAQSVIDGLTQVIAPATGLLDTTKVVDLTTAQTLTNKVLTSPTLNTGVSGTAIDTDTTLAANSDTKLASQKATKAYVDANASNTSGWISSSDTWTYVSASTFKITGADRTTTFTKGTRLKFTQTTTKYAVVVSSSFSTDTTVTIAVNTDYTIANAAITSPNYSYQSNPQGYPDFFNFTPANITWDSVAPTTLSTTLARYSVTGKLCTMQVALIYTNAGTTNALCTFDGPIAAAQARSAKYLYPVSGFLSDDASGPVTFPCAATLYSQTPTFYVQKLTGNLSAKYATCFAQYEI